MLISLVLLALFLLAYLYKNYRKSESDLRDQTQLYMENAFKSAEAQMFDRIFLELNGVSIFSRRANSHNPQRKSISDITFMKAYSQNTPHINISDKKLMDTIHAETLTDRIDSLIKLELKLKKKGSVHIGSTFSKSQKKSTNRKISFIGFDTLTDKQLENVVWSNDTLLTEVKTLNKQWSDSSKVKIKINVKSDSIRKDTAFELRQMTDIEFVKKNFKDIIVKAGIDIHYLFTEDSLKRGDLRNPKYSELMSGKEIYLNIDNNQWYLIKKLIPDIIISILLFMAVCFAFYHLITSHRKNQALSDLKDDFMRNMTHELKTPLATIGVAIEALQNFKADGDKQLRDEYLRIAENENYKLSNLVDKVLSISGHLDHQNALTDDVHLPNLAEDIIQSFKLRLDQKSIHTKIDNRLTHSHFQLNQQVLAMVMHNLIDNAIKYNHTAEPVIHVKLEEDDENLYMTIHDNGSPVDNHHKQKIFEKFYRIPSGNVHDVKGHGLGLYIVKQLISSVNGSITLQTDEQGNHFIVRLPKINAHQ
jgi:signal transduction histidine kinase